MVSSSSSASFCDHGSSREPTPEFDPIAVYKALAPLHWDAEEWDFTVVSDNKASLTDGEDLQLLLGEDLEESEDDLFPWDGADSSLEGEEDDVSSEEDPMAEEPLFVKFSDDDDDNEEGDEDAEKGTGDASGSTDSDGEGSGDDDDDGSSDGDGKAGAAPPPKRRKV